MIQGLPFAAISIGVTMILSIGGTYFAQSITIASELSTLKAKIEILEKTIDDNTKYHEKLYTMIIESKNK